MTALTTTASRPLATTASAECSPGLWSRLTGDDVGRFSTVASVVGAPALREEVRAVLPMLEACAASCGPEAVVAELAPLATVYGVPDRSQGEWAAFWRFYTDALADLPLEALKAGVKAYNTRSDSEFFPKPGPLRALCEKTAATVRTAAWRARIAAAAKSQEEARIERADDYRRYLEILALELRAQQRAA